jgi:hypothetical protein
MRNFLNEFVETLIVMVLGMAFVLFVMEVLTL